MKTIDFIKIRASDIRNYYIKYIRKDYTRKPIQNNYDRIQKQKKRDTDDKYTLRQKKKYMLAKRPTLPLTTTTTKKCDIIIIKNDCAVR